MKHTYYKKKLCERKSKVRITLAFYVHISYSLCVISKTQAIHPKFPRILFYETKI